jgi:hypothetical protein
VRIARLLLLRLRGLLAIARLLRGGAGGPRTLAHAKILSLARDALAGVLSGYRAHQQGAGQPAGR